MNSFYKIISIVFLCNFLLSQDDGGAVIESEDRTISPIIQIRYDNFTNDNFSPSSAIGIILKIDENRYTYKYNFIKQVCL